MNGKRQFEVVQVFYDGSQQRYTVWARTYESAWRNRLAHAEHLLHTRSFTIHEIGCFG
jgi:hypothetical protein